MHLRAEFFEPLFVVHPKALFFINHQKPKIGKAHPFGQERVGADDNINCPIRQPCAGFCGFFRGHKAGQLHNFKRKTTKPLGKGAGVLTRKQRGGGNHRHLQA